MIKNLEHISETKKRLSVEIPADRIEEKIRESLNQLRVRTKLPGFRPGKAPISLLEKRYGQSVEADVLEKMVPEYYSEALKEAQLLAVSHPEFEKREYTRKNPFEMVFTVEVLPEIKKLEYEGISVKDEDVAVEENDIEESMKRLQAERISYESVERPAEANDLLNLDYEIVEEEKEFKDQMVKFGSDQFPEEFFEGLKGKKSGDIFEKKVVYPEDHPSEHKGKTLTYKGTIKEAKVLKLPEIDDQFAKDIGYESLAVLKDSLKADILAAKKQHVKKKQMVEIIEKLVEAHKFPVPEIMLNAELNSLLTSEKTKEENKDKDEETLKKELMAEAEKTVKANVLLNIIGEKESVTVTEEEMKEKILELSQMTMIPPQNLIQMYVSKDGSLEGLRYGVFKEKVSELLHSKAKIEKGE